MDTLKHFLNLNEMNLGTMGRKGRKLIEEKYSAKAMAKEMMLMYNSL